MVSVKTAIKAARLMLEYGQTQSSSPEGARKFYITAEIKRAGGVETVEAITPEKIAPLLARARSGDKEARMALALVVVAFFRAEKPLPPHWAFTTAGAIRPC
jgi:hypothetical protein